MTGQSESPSGVVVVGSASSECVLVTNGSRLEVGRKHVLHSNHLIGGSGVNYSLRLMHAGFDVYPIVSVGDDEAGHNVQDQMVEAAKEGGLSPQVKQFVAATDFLAKGVRTPCSTVVVSGPDRTIFTEGAEHSELFVEFVNARLDHLLNDVRLQPSAIVIGHIGANIDRENYEEIGEATKNILRRFRRYRECLTYVNFGGSQIQLGCEYWQDILRVIDIFQLNLGEMRKLLPGSTLQEIIEWLQERGKAIITLDKLGAIGIAGPDKSDLVIAWPIDVDTALVDSTGAGDAFGAGVVGQLAGKRGPTRGEFLDAMETARLWAAHACRTLGGASQCPNAQRLREYEASLSPHVAGPVQPVASEAPGILWVLDQAYGHAH